MRVHCLMNIAFEGPGYISDWIVQHGHTLEIWRLYEDKSFPDLEEVDMLVVMGGPMNIYEEERYPYLSPEKEFILASIKERKYILGICLGAQLIADALGKKVFKNKEKEIGWFPVQADAGNADDEILAAFPGNFTPFHWHGETFGIPDNARLLGSSDACRNQGFLYGDHVLALQFHLEITPQMVDGLLQHAARDMTPGKYVQTAEEIRKGQKHGRVNREILFRLLERFQGPAQKK